MNALANPMTAEEKALARHALGLTNGATVTSRNFFVCPPGSADHAVWMRMVERHLARHRKAFSRSQDLFLLTRAGADRALEPGETLDTANFPNLGQD